MSATPADGPVPKKRKGSGTDIHALIATAQVQLSAARALTDEARTATDGTPQVYQCREAEARKALELLLNTLAEEQRTEQLRLKLQLANVESASADDYFTGPDYTGSFLETLFTSDANPPSFDALPEKLPFLETPLPMLPSDYNLHLLRSNNRSLFMKLAMSSTKPEPARALAQFVSYSCTIGEQDGGKYCVLVDAEQLVTKPVLLALRALRVSVTCINDVVDPSGTTRGQLRPDSLVLLNDVGMFKMEAERYREDFDVAVIELHEKMASWSTTLHGSREYMLCCAAAETRLQFYAVTRGGEMSKPVSRMFNTCLVLDRLEIIHTALAIVDILLRQLKYQMPSLPVPLGVTFRRGARSLTYWETFVVKKVKLADSANNDLDGLQQVYNCIASLQNEPGLDHPRGILRPIKMPALKRGLWCVEMPLATRIQPKTEADWKALAKDVLHGLKAFHEKGIVHRDVRTPNIMKKDDSYVLIDFEHSGVADKLPPFMPPAHWPKECQQPGASYATSADIYSLGKLMPELPRSKLASNLHEQLLHIDPKQRPSAEAALRHSWFTTS